MSLLIVQPILSPIASTDAIVFTAAMAMRGSAALLPTIDSEMRFTGSATLRQRSAISSQNRMVWSTQSASRATARVGSTSTLSIIRSASIAAHGNIAGSNRVALTENISPAAKAGLSTASTLIFGSTDAISGKCSIASGNMIRTQSASSVRSCLPVTGAIRR